MKLAGSGADERAEIIFFQALKCRPCDRAAFLERACDRDVEVREEVEGLLRDHYLAGDFLVGDGLAATELAAACVQFEAEEPGAQIGPYKLLQRIGEGGCGVVWMAEQEFPVRRRVALKIIKLGLDTKNVIARFEAERQALALMDHPNIAKVLDAGATKSGRPYFVMELVRGTKINEFCDDQQLSTEDRLRLFIQVCHAVQHAHQKGIIHRDLKPSNILITLHDGTPVPRVIDFGIAKATTGQRLTDKTLFTAFEQFIGTPAYMSPEQAEMSGLDIDTRADIYSLGVLLYELLTGRTPFDAHELISAGLDAMRRTIREQEPLRPSTRLSTLQADDATAFARQHRTDPSRISHSLRGDLDWIVMKALEKDRSRRYETAIGLALDIKRHLDHEPVTARPPSRFYRFQKVVERNKLRVAAAAAVLATLVAGLGLSTWMFLRERTALAKESAARHRAVAAEREQSRLRERAELQENAAVAQAAKSTHVAEFLTAMLEGVGPSVALGRDTALLHEILDRVAERLDHDLQDQPGVEAELRHVIGSVYYDLGDDAKSRAMHEAALALRIQTFGEEHPAVAQSLCALAKFAENAEALERQHRDVLSMRRRLLGDEHPDVLESFGNVAIALRLRGKTVEAEALARRTLALVRKLHGPNHPDAAEMLLVIAQSVGWQGRLAESEALHLERLQILRAQHGEEHPDIGSSLLNLAQCLRDQGRLEEAEAAARNSLIMMEKLLGSDHPTSRGVRENFIVILNALGKEAEAEAETELLVQYVRNAFASDFHGLESGLSAIAEFLYRQRKFADAVGLYREVVAMLSKRPPSDAVDLLFARSSLGRALTDWVWTDIGATMEAKALEPAVEDRAREAERLLSSVLADSRTVQILDWWRSADMRSRLGWATAAVALSDPKLSVDARRDRLVKVKSVLVESSRALLASAGLDHKYKADAVLRVAGVCEALGEADEAAVWRRKRELLESMPALVEAVRSFQNRSLFAEAEVAQRQVISHCHELLDHPHWDSFREICTLGEVLTALEKWDEAEAQYREALAMLPCIPEHTPAHVRVVERRLAICVSEQGRLAEADRMLEDLLALHQEGTDSDPAELGEVLRALGQLRVLQGDRAEAEVLYRRALELQRHHYSETTPPIFRTIDALATQLEEDGRWSEAEAHRRGILEAMRQAPAFDPQGIESGLCSLAQSLFRQSRFDEAVSLLRECLESKQSRLPEHALTRLNVQANLARALTDWAWSERRSLPGAMVEAAAVTARAREAEHLLRECVAIRERARSAPDWRSAGDLPSRLGAAVLAVAVTDSSLNQAARLAAFTEAESLLRLGEATLSQLPPSRIALHRDAVVRLVRLYESWNKPGEVAEWSRKLDSLSSPPGSSFSPTEESGVVHNKNQSPTVDVSR